MAHHGIPFSYVYNDCIGWYAPGSPVDPFKNKCVCTCVEFKKFEEIDWKDWVDCENIDIPERGATN